MSAFRRRLRFEHSPLILGVLLSGLALIQAVHRARKGRSAFLRWDPDFEAFWSGAELYATGAQEGYPTLPVTLVLMEPFRVLGPVLGSAAWATFKIGLAWWLVTRALRLASASTRSLSPWAQLAIVLLSFRPLLSDVLHGNLNLVVGAVVATAAWAWYRGKPLACGAWLGFGAALKATPALGLLFLLCKRSGRGGLGFGLGLALGILAPAPFVGLERTLELDAAWWHQMVAPYAEGRELTLLQTQHINQSLLGVLGRYLTDAVAIAADPPDFPDDVSIGIVALSPQVFRTVHVVASGLVLLFLGLLFVRRTSRDSANPAEGRHVLAEFSALALAMLLLSERSWKHHHVLLAFPLAFLVCEWVRGRAKRGGAAPRIALLGLALSAIFHGASGSAFLGDVGSDLAEAYGAYFIGDFVMLVCVGTALLGRDPPSSPR